MPQQTKEQIASEQSFFDDYYRESLARVQASNDVVAPMWIERALRPRRRPLDWWEHSFYLLGAVRGKRVLDLGCGGGWITRLLVSAGASVVACDVSLEGCRLTRDKLKSLEGVTGSGAVAVADAHAIPYQSNSFDAIWMSGVLHHVNIEKVSTEASRVLKTGGRVVFYEPMPYGPIMWKLRQFWLRLNGLHEYDTTEHEEGLSERDLAPLKDIFATSYIRRFNFIGKVNRLRNRFGPLATTLQWIDYALLSSFPFLRRYCTTIVCRFEK